MKIITRLLSSQSESHLRLLLHTNKQPLSLFSPPPQQKTLSLMLKWSWQFRQRYTTTTVHMGTLLLMTGSRLLRSSTWQHHAAMNLLSLSKFWLHRIRIRSPDTVVFYLVGANVAVFILWKNANPSFMIKHFTISRDNFTSGRLHTLITGAFSHCEASHLTNNMITLYLFGQSIGEFFGTTFLLKMYVGGAISGSIFYLVHKGFVDYNQGEQGWSSSRAFALGASAAVNGIILLYVSLVPTSVVYYNFIPLPAAMLGAIKIGTDLWRVYKGDSKISGAGHLGGAFVGVVVYARIRRWI